MLSNLLRLERCFGKRVVREYLKMLSDSQFAKLGYWGQIGLRVRGVL